MQSPLITPATPSSSTTAIPGSGSNATRAVATAAAAKPADATSPCRGKRSARPPPISTPPAEPTRRAVSAALAMESDSPCAVTSAETAKAYSPPTDSAIRMKKPVRLTIAGLSNRGFGPSPGFALAAGMSRGQASQT